MAPGDTARVYHYRLTAYDSGREWDAPVDDPRLLTEFKPNVLATFPAHCKRYPLGLPVVDLPRRWPSEGGSATAVLAGQNTAPPATLNLERLARLLHPRSWSSIPEPAARSLTMPAAARSGRRASRGSRA
jgi:hypothetical protein